jgi:hypothetical protein
VTWPDTLDENTTPRFTAEVSPESTFDGDPLKSRIVSSGETAEVCEDAAPVPTPFVAATVNVYAVPFVNPVTIADVAEPLFTNTGDCAEPPIYGVTV